TTGVTRRTGGGVSFERRVQRMTQVGRAAAVEAIAAGKRTLTEQLVQRRAEDAPTGADVHAAAAHGTSGAATTLPHLASIQQLFARHDGSGRPPHVGRR